MALSTNSTGGFSEPVGHENRQTHCQRCARPLGADGGFGLAGEPRCLRCTLRHRPLLRRSALTALVVGTALVGINQGNVLLDGEFPAALAWKVPLTYAVPFGVATWGALINNKV